MKYIIILAFILISLIGNTTNYYIKNTGSDAESGLSDALAWQNISKLNSTSFAPGDNIYMKCGDTWSGTTFTVPSGGVGGSQITLTSYGTGAKPIIIAPVNNAAIQVTSAGRGYWTIDGLDLRTSGVDGIFNYSIGIYFNYWGADLGVVPGWEIQNCTLNSSMLLSGPAIEVRGNTITGQGSNCHGGAIIIRGVNGENALIENNTISNYIDRGIWVYNGAPAPIVRNNVVHNIVAGSDNDGMGINIDGYGTPVYDAKVYGNHVSDCAGVGISNENGYNAEYYNNLIERCGWAGLDIIFYDANRSNASNIYYHHNIVIDCNRGFMSWDANTYTLSNNVFYNGVGADKIGFRIESASTYVSNITYINNIVSGSWTHIFSVPDTKSIFTTFDNNILIPVGTEIMRRGGTSLSLSQVQALGYMTNGLTSDPQFISAGIDFQLQSTSPAKDSGINTEKTSDFLGVSIYNSTQDIGAYEYRIIIPHTKKAIYAGNGKIWGKNSIVYGVQ